MMWLITWFDHLILQVLLGNIEPFWLLFGGIKFLCSKLMSMHVFAASCHMSKFSLQAYLFCYITFEIHIWENIKPYSWPLTHIMIFFFEEWGSVLHDFLRIVLEMFIFHFIADTVFCLLFFFHPCITLFPLPFNSYFCVHLNLWGSLCGMNNTP